MNKMIQSANARLVKRAALLLAIGLTTQLSSEAFSDSRINAGTRDWVHAAQTGRADTLVLGDSIVSYGMVGWANGIAGAAKRSSLGLSGSGLLVAPDAQPSNWVSYAGARVWQSGATPDILLGGDLQGVTPTGHYYSQNDFGFVGTGYDAVGLDRTKPIDWHVFAAATGPDASIGAERDRRVIATWSRTVTETFDPVPLAAAGLDHKVFHFSATSDPGDWNGFGLTGNSQNAAVVYTKLTQPNSTGIAVTGWSHSGGTTAGFRSEFYNNDKWDNDGRAAFYDATVAGDSGKLNVVITFGVNDAGQRSASDYGNDMKGLIADVRRDWSAAGHDAGDLSFTLTSAYQVDASRYGQARFDELESYRAVLDGIAAGDSQISFVDVWGAGPTWQEALAHGYLADPVHPTGLGTEAYSNVFLQQLLAPEPTTLVMIAGLGIGISRRRRG